MTLGEKLKELRTLNNYRLVEVSAKLNISIQVISKWENDKVVPSQTNLNALANLYDVDVRELTKLIIRQRRN